MTARGDPLPTAPGSGRDERTCTALWGETTPEGPLLFHGAGASPLPHLPALLCHASARARVRPPNGPGAPTPEGSPDDYDLHPRPEPWVGRRPESGRPAGRPGLAWRTGSPEGPSPRYAAGRTAYHHPSGTGWETRNPWNGRQIGPSAPGDPGSMLHCSPVGHN